MHERIPGTLNVFLLCATFGVDAVCLSVASHGSGIERLLAVIVFAFVNNTTFSLLHEAVHGILHPWRGLNDWGGRVAAAMFPTGFTFQRLCHLGHHRRNRTDAELFDYYTPNDNLALKYVQWYGILTGVYWLLPPLGCLLYLLLPGVLTSQMLRGDDSKLAQQAGADAMLSGLDAAPSWSIRMEIVFSFLVQLALWHVLHLTPLGWGLCYAAFGFNWSSLQYTDHAFSARDVRNGAWNLRVPLLVRALFLNYHHHKAHHQHPTVPWIHLDAYVDGNEPRPSFWDIYRQMWRGPRPLPRP